jgi:hypothetical protein
MYYIYHIKGVKIGCSTDAKRRVKQQGYTEFEILESHVDIDTASKREVELQSEYGYNVDTKAQVYSNQFSNMGKKANGIGNKIMIENKIGLFGVPIEQRREWALKASRVGVSISADKRRGIKLTDDVKQKMSDNSNCHKLKLLKYKCEHCGKEMNIGNYYKWHGDKCRNKKG